MRDVYSDFIRAVTELVEEEFKKAGLKCVVTLYKGQGMVEFEVFSKRNLEDMVVFMYGIGKDYTYDTIGHYVKVETPKDFLGEEGFDKRFPSILFFSELREQDTVDDIVDMVLRIVMGNGIKLGASLLREKERIHTGLTDRLEDPDDPEFSRDLRNSVRDKFCTFSFDSIRDNSIPVYINNYGTSYYTYAVLVVGADEYQVTRLVGQVGDCIIGRTKFWNKVRDGKHEPWWDNITIQVPLTSIPEQAEQRLLKNLIQRDRIDFLSESILEEVDYITASYTELEAEVEEITG